MAALVSPLLWSFLPSQITHAILPTISAFVPFLLPPAPRGSPLYARNYRLVITTLVVLWLAYNFVSGSEDESLASGSKGSGSQAEIEWYSLLGVEWKASDDEIKKAFRTLSRSHHPDRAGPNNGDSFIAIRHAYERLSDPIKRFAYDRFGPSVGESKAASVREHIMAGLVRSSGFYIFSGGLMFILGLLGKARDGAYWRYTLFVFMFLLELNLLISPTTTPLTLFSPLPLPISIVLRRLIPPSFLDKPPFLLIRTLHRLWTSLSIGISQLASVWADPPDDQIQKALDAQLLALATACQAESVGALNEEVSLIVGRDVGLEPTLMDVMEDTLVDRFTANHPRVAPYYMDARQRIAKEIIQAASVDQAKIVAPSIPLPPSPRSGHQHLAPTPSL